MQLPGHRKVHRQFKHAVSGKDAYEILKLWEIRFARMGGELTRRGTVSERHKKVMSANKCQFGTAGELSDRRRPYHARAFNDVVARRILYI